MRPYLNKTSRPLSVLSGVPTQVRRNAWTMNRPRNRQPRPDQQDQTTNSNAQQPSERGRGRGRRGHGWRGGRHNLVQHRPTHGSVPNVHQIIPGANVYIVLKEDQPTGEETHGVVQDVLTRGNHPRGIKVRLRDGQVGRVQRMSNASGTGITECTEPTATAVEGTPSTRFTHRYTDVRNDDYLEGPPPRSLADFLPPEPPARQNESTGSVVKCPFCAIFEGDEMAVSHHIDREHLE